MPIWIFIFIHVSCVNINCSRYRVREGYTSGGTVFGISRSDLAHFIIHHMDDQNFISKAVAIGIDK